MRAVLCSILSAAMLAAGVLAQLVPPIENNTSTPVTHGDPTGALALQNYYRGQLNLSELTWCDNLTHVAQVAADWAAGADIPETPINFTRRSTPSYNYSMEVVYLTPGTPPRFGAFYQATLHFWADHIHYHGEVIPDGDFFKYSAYSKYPPKAHTYNLPGQCLARKTVIANNNPILKPR